MQLTIFGASGKVGRLVVALALERGYDVVAFVHSRQSFPENSRLKIVQGDVHDSGDVERALKGSDAVISTLGSWGTKQKDILSSAMRAIIPAMEQEGIQRIITLTGSGAAGPDKSPSRGHALFMKLLSPTPAGEVFFDGEEHMRLLAASTLDWTTIRSPVMNNRGSTGYTLSSKSGSPFATIHRQAVALAMLDQLEADDFTCQAPIIHRG